MPPKPARRPITPAASPAARAKPLPPPALALVGRIMVDAAGSLLIVVRHGRIVAREPVSSPDVTADLRHVAQVYFGKGGGMLKKSAEQPLTWLVFH